MSLAIQSRSRSAAVVKARQLNALTIGWNVVEGIAAVLAGVAAGSLSLVGFGLDSGIEVSAALILTWRLRQEASGQCQQASDVRAQRGVAISFALLGAYVLGAAALDVLGGQRPEESKIGIAIAALSLVVMPLLARAKRRAAVDLGSRAAVSEAGQTDLCTMLSAALLIGLGANAAFGWWWADSGVAFVIGLAAIVMAHRTWYAESLADTCCS